MILSFLFYAILTYLAYRLVFGFIIPVYRTTKKVKRGFRDMQERMQEQARQYQQYPGQQQPASGPSSSGTPGKGDYIDFEEIK